MSQMNLDTPIVQVNNIVKNFKVGGTEVNILKGISFEVNRGEFVSIVGLSGNGKSTLLNMITGIDRPSSGEIFVTGRAVHRLSENELAGWRGENVGIIFQFFQYSAALVWLAIILAIAALASIVPARSATRISVRESLAYA